MSQCRQMFEEWTRTQGARWNLGTITVNGKFDRYLDPDTDTAWLGWSAGWLQRAALANKVTR